jgi:hypothetical protein
MQTAMTIVEELKVQVDKDRVDLLGGLRGWKGSVRWSLSRL